MMENEHEVIAMVDIMISYISIDYYSQDRRGGNYVDHQDADYHPGLLPN
jgi:hypothetical protein